MKHLILTFLLLLPTFPLLSQTKGNVTVCVRDSANKALQDANVSFFRADSLAAVITSGKNGCCSLALDTGNYAVHVSHIGYEEYDGEVNITPDGVNPPPIVLRESAIELNAVTVSDQTFKAELNKSSFKISGRIKQSSTDVYQILATVPALTVNTLEKTVALAGSDNSLVMVNNIRRDRSYLSLLKPENIDRVEIVRYPGSRYQNIDAIINIVAKAPSAGQSGYIGGRLEPVLKQGYADGGYTYITEKVSASLFLQDFWFDEKNNETSIIRDVRADNRIIRTEKNSDNGTLKMNGFYAGTSVDYTVSPKTFISLGAGYVLSPQSGATPYTGSVSSDGRKEYDFEAANKHDSDYDRYNLNLYYQTDFNKIHSVSVDAEYGLTKTESNSSYREYNAAGHRYENLQTGNSDIRSLNAQINFQQQLSKLKLEEGYRLYRQDNRIDNSINGVDYLTEHSEWRNYVYANLLGSIGEKFVYRAGTGFDMSQTNLNGAASSHNELTPNAMLRYIMKGGQNLTLNYSLTRKSPSSSALNPTPEYVDSSRIITGNPDLKPYYLNFLRFSYELNKNRFYMQTYLQYNLANNYITRKETLDDGIYHITYVNASRYSGVTAGINLSIGVFNWWRIMLNSSTVYNMYEDDSQAQLNKNYWTAPSLWMQHMINYRKLSVNLMFPLSFRTATLTGYSKSNSESSLNVSYRLNNSWSLTGMFRYLMPSSYKTETYNDDFSEIYYLNQKDRYLRVIVGVRYNFQKGRQQNYRQRNTKQYNDEVDISADRY